MGVGGPMRAVVTGAAGFIGSHLTERLLADGVSVVGVDSFTDYYDAARKRRNLAPALADPAFGLVEGSLTELDLRRLLEQANVVYHLAAQPGVRQSWGRNFDVYLEENVLATQKLLEAARGTGLERVVFASSSSIYGDAERYPTREDDVPRPVSPYGVTKLAAEHLCRLYWTSFDVPVTVLRYFTVYGPRQRPDMALSRFIEGGLTGRAVTVYGDGGQSRDFTFVADVVEATVRAGGSASPGSLYNIAGGSQVTVLDLIGTVERVLGKPIGVKHVPASPGEPRKTGADTEAARRELGVEPATQLEEGILAQVEAQAALPARGGV